MEHYNVNCISPLMVAKVGGIHIMVSFPREVGNHRKIMMQQFSDIPKKPFA